MGAGDGEGGGEAAGAPQDEGCGMIITPEYKAMNTELHARSERYGTSGAKWRDFVRNIAEWGRLEILDFGAGKMTLAKALGPAYRVTNYDPCVPGLDTAPEPHDIVVCGDVMEHVEPELVDNVLREIRRLTRKKAFFVIALGPSSQTLSDGRNAHLTLQPEAWWRERIEAAGFSVWKQKPTEQTGYVTWFICT